MNKPTEWVRNQRSIAALSKCRILDTTSKDRKYARSLKTGAIKRLIPKPYKSKVDRRNQIKFRRIEKETNPIN